MKIIFKIMVITGLLTVCFNLVACGSNNKASEQEATKESEQQTGGTEEKQVTNYNESLSLKEVLSVVLDENPSTGFSWEFTIEDDTIIQLDSEGKIEKKSDGEEIVGQPNQHEWKFYAISPGTTKLTFTYSQSWSDDPPAKVVEYIISVGNESVAFEAVSEPYPSEDQSRSAQIIKLDGSDHMTLRITDGAKGIKDLALDGDEITQILSAEWLNKNQLLGITSHINPSMNLYTLVEIEPTYEMSTFYGYNFTWNSDWSNMYYILAAPHFSEDTQDALMDKTGTVLYKTEGGNRLGSTLIITPDGNFIACDMSRTDEKSDLLIFKKQDNNTYTIHSTMPGYQGIPIFTDKDTLTITTDSGKVKTVKISELSK